MMKQMKEVSSQIARQIILSPKSNLRVVDDGIAGIMTLTLQPWKYQPWNLIGDHQLAPAVWLVLVPWTILNGSESVPTHFLS
jgi:hypothetical protein